jgi:hypothetical protein
MKTVWDITRTLTGIMTKNQDIHQLNNNSDISYKPQTMISDHGQYLVISL